LRFSWLEEDKLMTILTSILAVVMSLIVGGILILMAGTNPLVAYFYLANGAFGSVRNIAETLVKFTPLLLVGLGIAVAFKSRCFNIGAEGQIYLGAVTATWLVTAYPETPVLLPLFFICGFLGGGLWALFPGIIKAKLGVSEVISTLMMNYVALWLTNYLLGPVGPLRDPNAGGQLISVVIPNSVQLHRWGGTRFHDGFWLALLCAFLVYILFSKTTLGYDIRAVGVNPKAARYGGINVSKAVIISMFISGGLAGLAGAVELSGIHHRLIYGFSPGYGWTGIAVALLGGLQSFGIILSSLLMGGLLVGVDSMARHVDIPIFLSFVMQALVVLFLLAAEYLKRVSPSASIKQVWLKITGFKRREKIG